MLTISIIFALLVLLWGRVGVTHVDRLTRSDVESARRRAGYGASMPSFGEVVERSLALLRRRGRVSHTALRLEFGLDDATFAALREELVGVLGGRRRRRTACSSRAGAPPRPRPRRARAAAPAAHRRRRRLTPRARPAPGARHHASCSATSPRRRALDALDADDRAVVGARFHAICARGRRRLRRPRPAVGLRRRRDLLRPSRARRTTTRGAPCAAAGRSCARSRPPRDVVEREFGLRLVRAPGDRHRPRPRGADGAEPFGDVPRVAGAVQARAARRPGDGRRRHARAGAGAAFGFDRPPAHERFAVTDAADADAPAPSRARRRSSAAPASERCFARSPSAPPTARARAVLVRGEAGIGKTRLRRGSSARAHARRSGWPCCTARAAPITAAARCIPCSPGCAAIGSSTGRRLDAPRRAAAACPPPSGCRAARRLLGSRRPTAATALQPEPAAPPARVARRAGRRARASAPGAPAASSSRTCTGPTRRRSSSSRRCSTARASSRSCSR